MNRAIATSPRSRRRQARAGTGAVARLLGLGAQALLAAAALAGPAAHAQAAGPPGAQRPASTGAGAPVPVRAPPAVPGPVVAAVAAVAAVLPADAAASMAAAPASRASPGDAAPGPAAVPRATTAGATSVPAADAAVPAATPAAPAAPPPVPHQVLAMLRSPTEHARVDGSYGGGYGDAARARSQARVAARIAAAHGFSLVTQWPMPTLGMDCMVIALPPGLPVEAGIAALQSHAEVVWAQPMNEFEAQGRAEPPPGHADPPVPRAEAHPGHAEARPGHADPLYPLQPAAALWHLDDLHAVATGRRVRVALLDSGVDPAHPDLAQAVEVNENFVDGQAWTPERHGTAVAGLVAARADNGLGIVGIAPEARLLALRACWQENARQTLCNSLSLAKALNFAIEHHAEVINMSLSGPADPLLGRLIDVALARRQQVVAAVDARVSDGGFPADHPGVVAVADALSPLPPGLPGAWTAPARDLPAPVPGGGWGMVSGSSFAAGQVSGLLALLAQARADAGTRALLALASSSGGAEATARLVRLPGGSIDACASLLRVAPTDAAAGCRATLAASASAGASEGPGVGAAAGSGSVAATGNAMQASHGGAGGAARDRIVGNSIVGGSIGGSGSGSGGGNAIAGGSGVARSNGGTGIAAGAGGAAAVSHP